MGKLIDAEFLKDCLKHGRSVMEEILPDIEEKQVAIRIVKKFDEVVDAMPAVEAIPISWLKEQIELASSNGEDDYANAIDWTVTKWLTEVEDGQAD